MEDSDTKVLNADDSNPNESDGFVMNTSSVEEPYIQEASLNDNTDQNTNQELEITPSLQTYFASDNRENIVNFASNSARRGTRVLVVKRGLVVIQGLVVIRVLVATQGTGGNTGTEWQHGDWW